jgi:hypothetical protein
MKFKDLGRDAGFEDEFGHYNYRRWTANVANHTYLSIERNFAQTSAFDGRTIQYIFNVSNSLRELYQPGAEEGPRPVGRRGF